VTAWRWLGDLCKAGVLQQVGKGCFSKKRANEYRYLLPS
jgi:hypothetical protein